MALVRARSAARTLIKTVCRVVAAPCSALLCPEWRDNQRQARNFQHISPGYIQHPFSLRPHVRHPSPPHHPSFLFYCANVLAAVFALFWPFFAFLFALLSFQHFRFCVCALSPGVQGVREKERESGRERERGRQVLAKVQNQIIYFPIRAEITFLI